ncbi:ParB N-terminal domain-containing protein [Streptomyces sp. N2-109]|uniref:ParB N-terminal domain-containing protein n=1 Tax=Streptomyces gossypii TaxID=2883101 RepID=A0ABT2JPF2_9ACTN|nr:ParB N-terminal domain-containing protein [Streptomyces gossypii]MCT2589746.1 ParB N-terminal domain-containing protein [Streptomyces gossypii]
MTGDLLAAPGPVVTVAVGALRSAGSPRTAGPDLDHVRALAGTSEELPPIVVHRTTMRVIDGLHRLQAARLRRQPEIAVRFFDGDADDAFVFAVRANVVHGLPLSTADRKAAGCRIVASHPQWSDRLIASVTGLSPRTIAELRRGSAAPKVPERGRVGRDGRVRPVNSLEQRRLASDMLRENPQLSLRQVAAAVGISPETVRTVRARLLGGEDPVLPRRRGARRAPAAAGPVDTTVRSHVPDLSRTVQRLRADPSLRFTETGRALLRLLEVHMLSNEKWTALVHEVPPHTRHVIAKLAAECADGWRLLAEQLAQEEPDAHDRR